MIIPCFRKQLETFFSQAAYKATGTLIQCSCQLDHIKSKTSGLSYKIDIAHRLYRHYQKENFRFTQKGITPRSIAQETAIYSHQSPHFKLEIDSFGYFLVRPTDLYLKELQQFILKGNVAHYPIQMKNIKWKDIPKKPQGFILKLTDLSLSSLRIVFMLDLICRKRILLSECSPETVHFCVDCSALKKEEVQKLLTTNLFTLYQPKIQIKTGELLESNQFGVKMVSKFQEMEQVDWLGGCLRHRSIPFQKQYDLFEHNQHQLLKFGEIFPKITLSQLQHIYPQTYKPQLFKIMKYSLGFDHKLPIKLNHPQVLPGYQSRLDEKIGDRLGMGKVLIYLDQLGSDNVGMCFSWMKDRKKCEDDQRVWTILQSFSLKLTEREYYSH